MYSVDNKQNGVGYADITAIAESFAGASGNLELATRELIRATSDDVERYAKEFAPVRSGALRNSITSWQTNGGKTGIIAATVPYAYYVEFGTGTRGEFGPDQMRQLAKRRGPLLVRNGRKIVPRAGNGARPYLRPALLKAMEELEEQFATAAIVSIVKGEASTL